MGNISAKSILLKIKENESEDNICKLLKKYDIQLEYEKGNPVITSAIKKNKVKIVAKLIEMGYDINKTSHHFWITPDNFPYKEFWITPGNFPYKEQTILMVAIIKKSNDIATLLINNKNCNLEIKNENGMTAFAYAIYQHNFTLLNLMLTFKLDVDTITNSGKTYLMALIEKIEYGRIMLLVDNKDRDVGHIDKSYQFMKKNYDDLFKKLLAISDVTKRNIWGYSLLSQLLEYPFNYFVNTTFSMETVTIPYEIINTLYNKQYINLIIDKYLDNNDVDFIENDSTKKDELIRYLNDNYYIPKIRKIYETKIFDDIDNNIFLSSHFRNKYSDPNIIYLIAEFIY